MGFDAKLDLPRNTYIFMRTLDETAVDADLGVMKTSYFTAPFYLAPRGLTLCLTLCLTLGLTLCLTLPATAGTKDDSERDHNLDGEISTPTAPGTPDRVTQNPTERFVESNVLETLYHELGHALIDTMNLPVFGPEEHAADFFATIMLDRLHDEPTTRQLVLDVAVSYKAGFQHYSAAGITTSSWDEHANPMQRYYNLACLYLGGNPEERQDVAQELDLPHARARFCDSEFEMANYAWGEVLDELAEGAPANTISLDWILDDSSHMTQFVTRKVADLNKIMALPEPVTVSVIPCGEVNAYYDPGPKEIIMCTELSDHLASLAPRR